jgi:hypothetical protein
MNSEQSFTERFRRLILFGSECTWGPDIEIKDFVVETLKNLATT